MKKCQSCGVENEDLSLFCCECGAKLEEKEEKKEQRFCQHCGSFVEPGTLFCAECGKPLQAQEEKIFEEKIIQQVVEEVKPVEKTVEKPVQPTPVAKAVPTPPPVPGPAVEASVKEEAATKKKASIVPIIIVAIVLALVLGVGVFFLFQSGILGGNDKEDDKKVEENIDDEDDKDKEDEDEEGAAADDEEGSGAASIDTTNPIPVAASVSASSYLNDTNNVVALTDGNASTFWAEGVGGYGTGEEISYSLQSDMDIYGIAILPGDLTSSTNFYSNAYPTELEITDGENTQTVTLSSYTPSFDFSGNPYLFYVFDEPLHGDSITVIINDVKEGSGGQMTCITEMHLFTYVAEGSNVSVDPNAWSVAVNDMTGDYILPTSNTEYLTMEDLEGLTAEQCRLARNELYARYGRKFTDESLRTYFEAKDWYTGTIEPEDFTEDMLNEYEIYNRDLIVDYEEANGFR